MKSYLPTNLRCCGIWKRKCIIPCFSPQGKFFYCLLNSNVDDPRSTGLPKKFTSLINQDCAKLQGNLSKVAKTYSFRMNDHTMFSKYSKIYRLIILGSMINLWHHVALVVLGRSFYSILSCPVLILNHNISIPQQNKPKQVVFFK